MHVLIALVLPDGVKMIAQHRFFFIRTYIYFVRMSTGVYTCSILWGGVGKRAPLLHSLPQIHAVQASLTLHFGRQFRCVHHYPDNQDNVASSHIRYIFLLFMLRWLCYCCCLSTPYSAMAIRLAQFSFEWLLAILRGMRTDHLRCLVSVLLSLKVVQKARSVPELIIPPAHLHEVS